MRLLGKLVCIVDLRNPNYGSWGIVRGFNGAEYFIEVDGRRKVYTRNQFVVC